MQRQRPGHRIWSFHHRGLLLLAAAVAVMLFFLYGCVAGAAYSPRGRLVFIPLAQVSGMLKDDAELKNYFQTHTITTINKLLKEEFSENQD